MNFAVSESVVPGSVSAIARVRAWKRPTMMLAFVIAALPSSEATAWNVMVASLLSTGESKLGLPSLLAPLVAPTPMPRLANARQIST